MSSGYGTLNGDFAMAFRAVLCGTGSI